jgi:hypothetical protein
MTKLYELTVYLDDTKLGYGTVLQDYDIEHLISEADDWFGENTWNRLEITFDKQLTAKLKK